LGREVDGEAGWTCGEWSISKRERERGQSSLLLAVLLLSKTSRLLDRFYVLLGGVRFPRKRIKGLRGCCLRSWRVGRIVSWSEEGDTARLLDSELVCVCV